MATYVIGDVHGCFRELTVLIEKIRFNPDVDKLYFTGDLINRGPDSNSVIDFVKANKDSCFSVLGNHEISLLAYEAGVYKKKKELFEDVLQRRDSDEILEWISQLPLLIEIKQYQTILVHAGLPPNLCFTECVNLARSAEQILRSNHRPSFLKSAYKKGGEVFSINISEKEKFKYTLNAMTRMRFCFKNGNLELNEKRNPEEVDDSNLFPWYEVRKKKMPQEKKMIIFGHWAALGYKLNSAILCLDSGCAWGGMLTAVNLENSMKTEIASFYK